MKILKIILLINLIFFISCASHKANREKIMLARKYADKATVDVMKGNFEQAKAGFDLSLEIASIPESYDGLGCVAFYKKDYKLAEEYFIKAYNEDSNYLRALSNLALLYDVVGLKDESKNIYEFIIERSPEDYRFRNNFAGLLYDKDNEGKAQAKEELRKAITLKQDDIIVNNMKKVEGVGNKSKVTSVKKAENDTKKLPNKKEVTPSLEPTLNVVNDNKEDKQKEVVENNLELKNIDMTKKDDKKNKKKARKIRNKDKKTNKESENIDIDSFKF